MEAADVGYAITVTVTRLGNSGIVTSAPTAAVINELSQGTQGLSFALINGNTAYSVSRGTASVAEVVIPDIYQGLPVTAIAANGFSSYTNMASIMIPNRITTIGEYAFYNCSGLTNVTIPGSVTNIGNSAFSGCNSLTSITIPFVGNTLNGAANTYFGFIFGAANATVQNYSIPASLKTVIITGGNIISDNSFQNCSSLTSVTMPGSVMRIGSSAFSGCSGLASITIPNLVMNIGDSAFQGCSGLIEITLPSGIIFIGVNTFLSCTSLVRVTFMGALTESNFASNDSFPGDLRNKYFADDGGIGTYSRPNETTNTWSGAPTGLTVKSVASNSITFSWNLITGATGYKIYRSTSADGNFIEVGTSTTSSFTDIDIIKGTTYYYRLAAYYNNGTSPLSNVLIGEQQYTGFSTWNEWLTYKYGKEFSWDAYSMGTGAYNAPITHNMLAEEYFFAKGINAGWNLGNTYDLTGNPRALAADSRYDKLMAGVKAAGFNVIRIPVTWGSSHQNNTMPALLADVEAAATAAHDAGLVVFINTHHDKSYFNLTNAGPSWKTDGENGADYKTHTARFTGVWTLVAEHFKDFGDWLIFESLHEPTYSSPSGSVSWDGAPPEYHQVINNWNQLFVDLVRDSGGNNAKRYLIFKSYAGKLQTSLDPSNNFKIPDDPAGKGRLVFSYHSYIPQPLALEGQNGNWDTSFINQINSMFKQAQEAYLVNGIPVFLGETGATFHSQRTGTDSATANQNRLMLLNAIGYCARIYGIIPVLWDNGDATRA